MAEKCKVKRYYFDYLPKTKGNTLGKRRSSKDFCNLSSAMKDARKKQKDGKIVQAQFWKKVSSINHKIVSSLNTKGQIQARRFS